MRFFFSFFFFPKESCKYSNYFCFHLSSLSFCLFTFRRIKQEKKYEILNLSGCEVRNGSGFTVFRSETKIDIKASTDPLTSFFLF